MTERAVVPKTDLLPEVSEIIIPAHFHPPSIWGASWKRGD